MNKLHSDTEKEELWQWLARRTDLRELDEHLRAMLEKSDWMQEWQTATDKKEQSEYRGYLLKRLREELELLSRYGVVGSGDEYPIVRRRDTTRTLTLEPEGALRARVEAMCLYWAKLAEARREVREFRKNVLGGGPVSRNEARSLIRSPAAAVLSTKNFRDAGVPIVGHTAEFLSYERSKPYETPHWKRVTIKVRWSDGEWVSEPALQEGIANETLAFWDGEELFQVAPWHRLGRRSVLRELYDLAVRLSRSYPWEEVSRAAWLVLTGEPPWVPPVTANIRGLDVTLNHATITLTATQWVPAEVVAKFYSEAKVNVESTPTPSDRRLALFRFVTERSSGIHEFDKGTYTKGLNIPSWRVLLNQWNELHPPGDKWHYKGVQNFHRDYKETFRQLLGYGWDAS